MTMTEVPKTATEAQIVRRLVRQREKIDKAKATVEVEEGRLDAMMWEARHIHRVSPSVIGEAVGLVRQRVHQRIDEITKARKADASVQNIKTDDGKRHTIVRVEYSDETGGADWTPVQLLCFDHGPTCPAIELARAED